MKKPPGGFLPAAALTKHVDLVERLSANSDNRNALIQHFGGRELVPSSIMRARRNKADADHDLHQAERSYTKSQPNAKGKRKDGVKIDELPESMRGIFKASGSGVKPGDEEGALSHFHQEIGRTLILLYTKPGEVVGDPFCGHNSRLELTIRAGRHYMGNELSAKYNEFNRQKAAELKQLFPDLKSKITTGDSRELPFPTEFWDYSQTSPPYWNTEYYGDEPEQLGERSYPEFLDGMQQVMDEVYRCSKPGAHSAWFINDFRRKGKFYCFHADIIRLGEKAGFEMADMLIVDLGGGGFGNMFLNQYVAARRLPKRHEYACVFRKLDNTAKAS